MIWEGLRKKGCALDWMLSGSKNNSTDEYCNKFYLEEERLNRGYKRNW